ncbi:DUF4365 domain-containing protein [Micromonospora sp. NPDC005174]|uniref:DUF4365 domain-containing protein n=1 Tax=Micromonospora sp. NPDC005174 TaxID=3157018 RepID=UPI0033B24FD0
MPVYRPNHPHRSDRLCDTPAQPTNQTRSKIEAQVKSWSSPRGTDLDWLYPIDVRHYNNLAGEGFAVSRYLFLIIVPADAGRYAQADETSLRLSHCGYWASLRTSPLIDHAVQRQVTVPVPKRNVLTVKGLRSLLEPRPAQRVPAS